MTSQLTLVSHALCPYVQRAAIVLLEKGLPFTRRDIDLGNKPAWFLAMSPLGKTPVLIADDAPIFESAVICEYLDDVFAPRLHPDDPLRRARHRAWIEFASNVLNAIGTFYCAPDDTALQAAAAALRHKFEQLEAALDAAPFFDGERFSIVDAAFGPVFRYVDVFDRIQDFGIVTGLSKVQAWRAALAARPSVKAAAAEEYENLLLRFLKRRGSALSVRIEDRAELLSA
jgi:glutathione S-transferase